MEGVNLVGEKGFGPWLKSLRIKRNWTIQQTAQAATVGESTVLRYEKDKGPSYELLRLMDALGVKFRPSLPRASAGALNTEVRHLADRLGALEGKVDEVLAGVGDLLALSTNGEDDAGAQEDSP